MGQALFQLGDYSKSAAYFDTSYSIWSELDQVNELLDILSWKALANLKADEITLLKETINEIEVMIESSDSTVIKPFWILSQIYSGLGENEKAIQYLNVEYESIITKANSFNNDKFKELYLTITPAYVNRMKK